MNTLNRRSFLQFAGTGLGGIALTTLLAEQGLLGEDHSPIRPQVTPEHPLYARPPHFRPKAKNVLAIFCSGACSHLDTWDYKPELIKRDGQPMPGADKLITFQGEHVISLFLHDLLHDLLLATHHGGAVLHTDASIVTIAPSTVSRSSSSGIG